MLLLVLLLGGSLPGSTQPPALKRLEALAGHWVLVNKGMTVAHYGFKAGPGCVDWDLSKFEAKSLRLYVVDAATNHYGQIAISEVSILEDAPK